MAGPCVCDGAPLEQCTAELRGSHITASALPSARRERTIAEGAEDTAVPFLRAEVRPTGGAKIEEQTRIGRHRLLGKSSAFRAMNGGCRLAVRNDSSAGCKGLGTSIPRAHFIVQNSRAARAGPVDRRVRPRLSTRLLKLPVVVSGTWCVVNRPPRLTCTFMRSSRPVGFCRRRFRGVGERPVRSARGILQDDRGF
jgi:hypothetical protein